MTRPDIATLLSQRKVVCCVGSGGVGKTTTAAALAVRFAVDGKRTLVLTILCFSIFTFAFGKEAIAASNA